MSIRIGSNIASNNAIRRVGEASSQLQSVSTRLSSGLRITSAKDDAAGLSISESIGLNARVYQQAIRNINDGVSATNIVEGALGQLVNIVTRQKELAEQAANGVYSGAQRVALNKEANALVKEYNRIVQSVQFNNSRILDGTDDSIRVQQGYGLTESTLVSIGQQLGYAAGDGTFRAATSYGHSVGLTSSNALFLDVDSNGVLDMIATEYAGTGLFVRMGLGNGTFGSEITYYHSTLSSMNIYSLASGDFDGDGIADLVSANQGDDSFNVLLGNANGSFQAPISYEGNGTVTNIQVADFNGDGYDDVIRSHAGGITVMTANSNGSFSLARTVLVTATTNYVDIGDFNNDGIMDFTTSDSLATYTFLGNGNGTFRYASSSASPFGTIGVELADLNNDGNLDRVLFEETLMRVEFGNGDGSFTAEQYLPSADNIQEIEVADFNGDGQFDLLSVNNLGELQLQLGNGNGTFSSVITVGSHGSGSTFQAVLAVADLNNDGIMDVGASTGVTGLPIHVFLGNSDTSGRRNNHQYAMDLTTTRKAREALVATTERLRKISLEQGAIGAFQSRLSTSLQNLSTQVLNLQDAKSRITDADVAQDAAGLVRAKILQQASAAVLAQANQAPTLALKLLQAKAPNGS